MISNRLNARTFKDAHQLPHPSDALVALGGNAFFSTMDPASGYYNIEVQEEDRRYSAFTSPFALYEYIMMPQGLSNSPVTFMRMMLCSLIKVSSAFFIFSLFFSF